MIRLSCLKTLVRQELVLTVLFRNFRMQYRMYYMSLVNKVLVICSPNSVVMLQVGVVVIVVSKYIRNSHIGVVGTHSRRGLDPIGGCGAVQANLILLLLPSHNIPLFCPTLGLSSWLVIPIILNRICNVLKMCTARVPACCSMFFRYQRVGRMSANLGNCNSAWVSLLVVYGMLMLMLMCRVVQIWVVLMFLAARECLCRMIWVKLLWICRSKVIVWVVAGSKVTL